MPMIQPNRSLALGVISFHRAIRPSALLLRPDVVKATITQFQVQGRSLWKCGTELHSHIYNYGHAQSTDL